MNIHCAACLVLNLVVGVFVAMPHRMSFVGLAVAGGLLGAIPGRSVGAAEIPSDQRQAIERIIHDYLLKNPDVLIEALRGAEDKLKREADRGDKGSQRARKRDFR